MVIMEAMDKPRQPHAPKPGDEFDERKIPFYAELGVPVAEIDGKYVVQPVTKHPG